MELEFVAEGQRHVLHPRLLWQAWFCTLRDRAIFLSGAWRCGKTRALLLAGLRQMHIPGNRVGIYRETFAALRQTTLLELLEPMVYPNWTAPPILAPGTYVHHKSEHVIEVIGGARIHYDGCESPDRLGSITYGCVLIDEAHELSQRQFHMLEGRLSHPVAEPRQIIAASNPATPLHWAYRRFWLDPLPGDRAITVPSFKADGAPMNPFLPQDYLDRLKRFTGAEYDRYVLGKWSASEGLVYRTFNVTTHVVHRDGPWKQVVAGVDPGFTNPVAVTVTGFDGDERAFLIEEVYQAGILETDLIAHCVRLKNKYGVTAFPVDPSEAELIAAMRLAGLPAVKAVNDVSAGIRTVQDRLNVLEDGKPRLAVDPSCTHAIEEFQSYQWAEHGDKPVKESDHAMDALRYTLMHVDSRLRPRVGLMGPGREFTEEELEAAQRAHLDPLAGLPTD